MLPKKSVVRYPYYVFEEDDYRVNLEGRYWHSDGKRISIVAVVTKGIDWAAYINADDGWGEKFCLQHAAHFGAKLSEKDARYFFPAIKLPYRP